MAAYFKRTLVRQHRIKILAILAVLGCYSIFSLDMATLSTQPELHVHGIKSFDLSGFVQPRSLSARTCGDIVYQGQVNVKPSLYIQDDLPTIATDLRHHPAVAFPLQHNLIPYTELIEKMWFRTAQSSVWLEHYQVYLTITRIIFADKGAPVWSTFSFLRGQIHDHNWNELKNYSLEWQNKKITFPKIFDIDAPYKLGDPFYGPEDPRVTIDSKIENNPEPLVVFSMLSSDRSIRKMYVLRPFSEDIVTLSLKLKANGNPYEKNWMPFFLEDPTRPANPSLHFVYNIFPLQVIQCSLTTGACEFVFRQPTPPDFKEPDPVVLTGGTNLVPLTVSGARQSFLAFPRTHINGDCDLGFYRPAMMLLTYDSGEFRVDYLSASLDLGLAASQYGDSGNLCNEGRIVIFNSIARWQRDEMTDLLTVSFSIDDKSTQTLRMSNIHRYLEGIIERIRADIPDPSPEAQLLAPSCAVEAAKLFSREANRAAIHGFAK